MKKIVFVSIIITEIVMGLFTYLVYDSEMALHLFSGGSIGSTMTFFEPNFRLVSSLFLLTILLTIVFRRSIKKTMVLFILSFSMWFISGRTVGIHWTGFVQTGWFYVSTGQLDLCNNNPECDDQIFNETQVKRDLFFLYFKNKTVDKRIYIGPLLKVEFEDYFPNKTE